MPISSHAKIKSVKSSQYTQMPNLSKTGLQVTATLQIFVKFI